MARPVNKKKKFCFKRDNDGHWFLLPIELIKEFREMLDTSENQDDYTEFNNIFEKYRSDDPNNYMVEGVEEL